MDPIWFLHKKAEETQIIGRTHTLMHTLSLPPTHSLPASLSPAQPDQSRVASSPGPGSPKELSPVVSERTLSARPI